MQSETINSLPHNDGFTMPAEWTPQQAVWMLWPYRPDNWRNHGRAVQPVFAAVAEAIAEVTPVYMGVPPGEMESARAIMPPQITLVPLGSDDCWVRDTGPTFVLGPTGELRGIDWRFNAWGGEQGGLYTPWTQDSAVAAGVLAHQGCARYQAPLVLEGGAIHVDGEGTLMTTAECLLNRNRNPQLDQAAIEALLRDYLGVRQFIWLPFGVDQDETDGHIDNLCCFVRPGEVLLHWCDDPDDPQFARSQAAREVLSRSRDAMGRQLKIHLMPAPGPLFLSEVEAAGVQTGSAVPRRAGERLAASYVNFLISNQRVIFPLLDSRTDTLAGQILQQLFPDHHVVGVAAREILLGGGNIHCITQQVPVKKKA
jgi:agmatine deiminase